MSEPLFTASQIAIALGKTKRAVQLSLAKIPADNVSFVRGQQADAWMISSLPCRLVEELGAIADRRGYRNEMSLLSDPPRRFAPVDRNGKPVAINEMADIHVQRALKRSDALALSLSLRERLTECDSKQIALKAFRNVMGIAAEETWNRWLKRVIQRDAGEERFEDLLLYCDDVVSRKPEARERIAIGSTAAERTVLDALAEPKDPAKPTLIEKAKIWETVVHFIDDAMAHGEKQKRAMRRVFVLISGSRVCLASSAYRLRRNMKEKFLRWLAGGRTFAALEDKRPANSGPIRKPKLNEEDSLKLIGHTVKNCGGRLSQGYRDLRRAGLLSPSLTSRFVGNPSSKSYVPAAIRREIAAPIRSLKAYHHGEREHRLRGPYHTRDWSGVRAGSWFQSDDLTAPVYFWKLGIDGAELTRGQFLPMIDVLTGMILGSVLIQEKNYNSISIRSLITKVCAEHGLPRRGFYFERGIWKTSKIISGRRDVDMDEIADTGIRRLGMEIRHAILPRAKVIERSLGQLQDLMEGLPGYCGRNEQVEKFERFQRTKLEVEAGRADARECFLGAEQLHRRFVELCNVYNNEPQQGRLKGLSPAEGWERLQGEEPRTRFDPRIHYFLASDLQKLKVTRNGVTIPGKQGLVYRGPETGVRLGQRVYAWWNPDCSDLLTCTDDLNGNGIFTLERCDKLPAMDATREQLAEGNRKIEAHNQAARNLYHVAVNSLPPSAFRGQLVSPSVVRLGEEMAAQQSGKRKQREEKTRLSTSIARHARNADLPAGLVHQAPETIEYLDEYTAGMAELQEQLAQTKEKGPQS